MSQLTATPQIQANGAQLSPRATISAVALVARQLGGQPLPEEEVRRLMNAREQYEANKRPVSVEWD